MTNQTRRSFLTALGSCVRSAALPQVDTTRIPTRFAMSTGALVAPLWSTCLPNQYAPPEGMKLISVGFGESPVNPDCRSKKIGVV